MTLKLSPDLDLETHARTFRERGRAHIIGLMPDDSAAALHGWLSSDIPWQTNFNDGEKGHTLHQLQVEALNETQRQLLLTHISQKAAFDFQYVFNAYSLSDARKQGLNPELAVNQVLDFVNSEEFLALGRTVTGRDDISFADAQCTLFRPGHFLSDHSDDVYGKSRVAAYVINMTPQWRPDWGGILQFIDQDGNISGGFTPAFNALNILRVPQPHAVSYVTPYAQGGRYSITGWFRTGEEQ